MLPIQDKFIELIEDITLELGNSLINENEEYQNLSQESIELFSEIKKHLPIDLQYLIEKYENIELLIQNLVMDVAYKQGLKNGIEIVGSLDG